MNAWQDCLCLALHAHDSLYIYVEILVFYCCFIQAVCVFYVRMNLKAQSATICKYNFVSMTMNSSLQIQLHFVENLAVWMIHVYESWHVNTTTERAHKCSELQIGILKLWERIFKVMLGTFDSEPAPSLFRSVGGTEVLPGEELVCWDAEWRDSVIYINVNCVLMCPMLSARV